MRVSGPAVLAIAARVIPDALPLKPRYAHRANVLDAEGTVIDDGLALYFQGPASATGEDVLELHLHGSPLIAETTLAALMAAGARLAGPGEFTRRAFLNGKLDLSAAEAVADLIAAESRSAARAAAATLGGALARYVAQAEQILRTLMEELSAAIDFPDEVPDPERDDVRTRLDAAVTILTTLISGGAIGQVVREGARVAIVGPPNAGKSSLLNALLGEDRVIVSPIAGTTRDTVEEALEIDGVIIRLVDTAGIRAEADALEAVGIERTQAALAASRLALIVLDGSQRLPDETQRLLESTRGRERVVFYNKADLGCDGYAARATHEMDAVHGSVRDAETIASIRKALREALVGNVSRVDVERPALARSRELAAAIVANEALHDAQRTLEAGEPLDLLAGDLHSAIAALGKITGATVSEETLDAIFARFCIGK